MCGDFIACGMLPAGHAAGRQVSQILNNNDNGPVEEDVLGHVVLAQTRDTSAFLSDASISDSTKHAIIHGTSRAYLHA